MDMTGGKVGFYRCDGRREQEVTLCEDLMERF